VASADAVAQLRLLIAEPDNAEPYTDDALSARLDANPDSNMVAYDIWTEKAAARADLADISEGGSSRKQGDLYEQALKMAEFYRGRVTVDPPLAGGFTRIGKLRRP
jgi:hypothetical protein